LGPLQATTCERVGSPEMATVAPTAKRTNTILEKIIAFLMKGYVLENRYNG
jgi:hypothetical protein